MARDVSAEVAYAPYSTFITALDTLNQHGLPDRIDRSIFSTQSGATQAVLMASLKALGAINESNDTQPILRRLVDQNQRKAALKEIVDNKYKAVLDLGPSATQKQFDDVFFAYGVKGATHRKAEAFFLKVADVVGIKLSPYISGAARSSSGSGESTRPKVTRRKGARRKRGSGGPTEEEQAPLQEYHAKFAQLHASLEHWIAEVPAQGEEWKREDFDSWLSIFTSMVERLYKIPAKKQNPN